jgi:YidC/Oxa1 family membrane protein insertase
MIAIAAFMAIMFGYNYFFEDYSHNSESVDVEETSNNSEQESNLSENVSFEKISIKDAISRASRISIENSNVIGSIDLNGGILDGVSLKNYKQTTDENSDNVMLLTPRGTETEYYYSINYKDKINDQNISDNAVWSIIENSANKAVIQTKTQYGVTIERSITLDDGYVITIKDRIVNGSNKDIKLSKSADLIRANPVRNNYAVVFEGLICNCKKSDVSEVKYSDIGKKEILQDCKWIGYTDIYWLCSLLNKRDKNSAISYSKLGDDSYKISLYSKSDIKIEKEQAIELSYSLFAGPKDINLLKNYAKNLKLDKFEMAIDFGWFFMITKPLVRFMDLLERLFSNMGLVILFLTLLFKIITYPLTKKSFESAAKMREAQPKIAAIQKMYAHDKMRMNQEMIAFYKKEKVSPLAGCLPMLLQAPIFFCLYKVFFISIEMRHAPLFGWIRDLSAPDQLYIFNLFGLIDWTPPSFLKIGIWPLIMGITMFLQQKLSSSVKEKNNAAKTQEMKMQENMMLIMPVLFTYICSSFPVGVIVYWTISNILGIVQQHYANTRVKKL